MKRPTERAENDATTRKGEERTELRTVGAVDDGVDSSVAIDPVEDLGPSFTDWRDQLRARVREIRARKSGYGAAREGGAALRSDEITATARAGDGEVVELPEPLIDAEATGVAWDGSEADWEDSEPADAHDATAAGSEPLDDDVQPFEMEGSTPGDARVPTSAEAHETDDAAADGSAEEPHWEPDLPDALVSELNDDASDAGDDFDPLARLEAAEEAIPEEAGAADADDLLDPELVRANERDDSGEEIDFELDAPLRDDPSGADLETEGAAFDGSLTIEGGDVLDEGLAIDGDGALDESVAVRSGDNLDADLVAGTETEDADEGDLAAKADDAGEAALGTETDSTADHDLTADTEATGEDELAAETDGTDDADLAAETEPADDDPAPSGADLEPLDGFEIPPELRDMQIPSWALPRRKAGPASSASQAAETADEPDSDPDTAPLDLLPGGDDTHLVGEFVEGARRKKNPYADIDKLPDPEVPPEVVPGTPPVVPDPEPGMLPGLYETETAADADAEETVPEDVAEEARGLLWDETPKPAPVPATTDLDPSAPISDRVFSALCDALVLVGLGAALVLAAASASSATVTAVIAASPVPLLLAWLVFAVTYAVFFNGTCGQTLGKMVMRVRVIGIDRFRISYGQAALRAAYYVAATLPIGAGLLPALRDPEHRAMHDRWSRTRVVKA